MKIPAGILSLLFPVLAVGQNYPGMGEGDAQNMMLQMQKMQACMQSVDQSRLKAYEQQANKVQAEVKTLCASGKRDEAQQKAVAFAQEFAGDPDTMKMMECSKMMSSAMPAMPFMDQANESDNSVKHVCDQ
jgi:N-acetylneuraminic acid mutarotase